MIPALLQASFHWRLISAELRHTFASLRAQQGVPPHVLKDWMGHSSIVTTMNIYAHVYDEDATTQDLLTRLYADVATGTTVELRRASVADE